MKFWGRNFLDTVVGDYSRKERKGRQVRRNRKVISLRSWRPFDFTQGMLGAIESLDGVLSNIHQVSVYVHPFVNTLMIRSPWAR